MTILVVGIGILALTIRLVCYTGLIASDDLDYARHAQGVADHSYRLESYQTAIRYGVFVPVALFYRMFGVHEWTTVALPLIYSSLAAVLTAIIAAQLEGLSVAWISGLLMATFPVEVRYGSILVPEPFLQAMLLCAALLFVLAEKQKNWFLGFASGVCLGFSYLTKEPAVFVAMAFVVFALVEHRWRLASSVLAGAVLVAAGELSWYWSETGDLLFRLHALAVHNTDTMDKAIRAANEHLAFRLLEAYPRMMLAPNVDFGLHSIFALALAAAAVFQRPFRKWTLFLLIWAALPFAYLNFGTSSFSYYWAIPALPRYISPIYPPLFILAAAVLLRTTATHPVSRGLGMVAVTIVCIVGVYCARLTRGTDYRTEHVRRLKQVAADARRNNQQICEFRGSEAYLWRLALGIIAPDRIGCSGAGVLRLVPDPMGLPVTKAL